MLYNKNMKGDVFYMIKKYISIICLVALFFTMPVFASEREKISIIMNGEELLMDQPPVIINGRTLVPFRAIFEAFGTQVSWDGETKTASAEKDGMSIKLVVNSNKAFVNNEEKELDVAPFALNGRTLVPVRFISETLGAKVSWDGENRMVNIETEASGDELEVALRRLEEELTGKDVLQYLIDIYDPETGLFYHTISSRDNEPFRACLEATWFAMQIMEDGGLLPKLPDEKPDYSVFNEEMQKRLINSTLDMQDEDDGYFYDPQWGKDVFDSRKGRDLMWARFITKTFDVKPRYLLPEERIAAEVKKQSDDSAIPTWLSSEKAFKAHLESLDWSTGAACYKSGSDLGTQYSVIDAAGLVDVARDFLSGIQNKETGLWGDGLTYDNTNASMKIAAFYDNEHPYPNVENMVDSVIYVLKNSQDMPTATRLWNPIQTISIAVSTYGGKLEEAQMNKIKSSMPDLIDIIITKSKELKKPDGGYASSPEGSTKWMSGPQSSLGLDESDMDGTTIMAFKFRESIYNILGIPRPKTHYLKYKEWFASELQNKEPVKKNPVGCFIDFEDVEIGKRPEEGWFFYAKIGDIYVDRDPYNRNNKVLRLFTEPGDGIIADFQTQGKGNPDTVFFECKFMLDSSCTGSDMFYNSIGQGVGYWATQWIIGGEGKFGHRNAGNVIGDTVTQIEKETWYNLRIEYMPRDENDTLVRYYIDDELVLETNEFYKGNNGDKLVPMTNVGGFTFHSYVGGNGTVFVDDIKLDYK